MTVIGIDPGITGALAILQPQARVVDMPVLKAGPRGRNIVDCQALCTQIIKWAWEHGGVVELAVEDVWSMPKEGVISAHNFGRSIGAIHGVAAALPVVDGLHLIRPQTWRQRLEVPKGKEGSVAKAMQLWPHLADDLRPKTKHGRSDALLIARAVQQ